MSEITTLQQNRHKANGQPSGRVSQPNDTPKRLKIARLTRRTDRPMNLTLQFVFFSFPPPSSLSFELPFLTFPFEFSGLQMSNFEASRCFVSLKLGSQANSHFKATIDLQPYMSSTKAPAASSPIVQQKTKIRNEQGDFAVFQRGKRGAALCHNTPPCARPLIFSPEAKVIHT